MDVATHVEVVETIARGCPSSAWVLSLISQQNFLASAFTDEAKREIYGPEGHLILALTMGPAGRAQPQAAGYRLEGRWPYVTGIDQATWCALTAMVSSHEAAPRPTTFLIPADACKIVDDWHVLGLRGTGSKTVVVESAFVPEHRTFSFRTLSPALPAMEGPTLNGVPIVSLFAMAIAAAAPGIASTAVREFQRRIRARRNAFMTSAQSDQPDAQEKLGRAAASAEMAHHLLMSCAQDLSARVARGEHIDMGARTRYRMQMAEVLRICTETVLALFTNSGTGAVFDSSRLQRLLRDMLTLRSHIAVESSSSAQNFGRTLLDLPPHPPFI
jgi:3-hydroxy-9,10-secoandrosta-1,3,5(10)-triene-9,17-dione monooxygenase